LNRSRGGLEENLSENAKKLRDDLEARNASLTKPRDESKRGSKEPKQYVPIRNNTSMSRDYTMQDLERITMHNQK
jgi:hypothetical protein